MAMTDAMAVSMVEGGGIADTIGGGIGIATVVVGIAIAGITTVTTVDMTGAIIAASPGKQSKMQGRLENLPYIYKRNSYLLLHSTHT
jgi:hypothetical protein